MEIPPEVLPSMLPGNAPVICAEIAAWNSSEKVIAQGRPGGVLSGIYPRTPREMSP